RLLSTSTNVLDGSRSIWRQSFATARRMIGSRFGLTATILSRSVRQNRCCRGSASTSVFPEKAPSSRWRGSRSEKISVMKPFSLSSRSFQGAACDALILLAAVVSVLAASSWMAAAEPSHPQLTPIVADVLAPPHAVPGSDGRTHLVYEIRIANV